MGGGLWEPGFSLLEMEVIKEQERKVGMNSVVHD